MLRLQRQGFAASWPRNLRRLKQQRGLFQRCPNATTCNLRWLGSIFLSVRTAAVCNDQKRRGDHVAHGVSPGSENSRAINFGYEHCKWHLHNAFALALHQQQRSNVLVVQQRGFRRGRYLHRGVVIQPEPRNEVAQT